MYIFWGYVQNILTSALVWSLASSVDSGSDLGLGQGGALIVGSNLSEAGL